MSYLKPGSEVWLGNVDASQGSIFKHNPAILRELFGGAIFAPLISNFYDKEETMKPARQLENRNLSTCFLLEYVLALVICFESARPTTFRPAKSSRISRNASMLICIKICILGNDIFDF